MNDIKRLYETWLDNASDKDVRGELIRIRNDEDRIEDAFYRDLEFGTGGLRGIIGAGTNRMNIYTVAKASQGLADYINGTFVHNKRIAIAYDSRIKSDIFARVAAEVFAANGIIAMIYKELMPTPCLSFAVRELKCSAGIVITASHNPAKYNGYKVYGADGCQITTEAAEKILEIINSVDIFCDVKREEFEIALRAGLIEYIPDVIYDRFVDAIKAQSLLYDDVINKDIAIVYSPLNGTGLKPVTRTLQEAGFTNITVVKEQELPDGNFPTCPFPNPEIPEALSLGMEYAKRLNANLVLATDPDCDRVGAAVRNDNGDYVLITGNEMGVILFDYVCSRRAAKGNMPESPVLVKTIVTTDMGEQIADSYGVKTVNVLTGFKFIGEQIGFLEEKGLEDSYIFGFEESYGYLSGTYVRDKDAVNGALLICEMFAYYAAKDISLLKKLDELYSKFGYRINTLHSYTFEGSKGFETMRRIMDNVRNNVTQVGDYKIKKAIDYLNGIGGLPKSNVIKLFLENGCTVVIRPSGTEPKIKVYISVVAENENALLSIEKDLFNEIQRCIMI